MHILRDSFCHYKFQSEKKRGSLGTQIIQQSFVPNILLEVTHFKLHHGHIHSQRLECASTAATVVTQRRLLLCCHRQGSESQFSGHLPNHLSQPCREDTARLSAAIYPRTPCGRRARRGVLLYLPHLRTLTSRCSKSTDPRENKCLL
jgi:hypothetical protein